MKVLRPIIGHFGDVLPSQSLGFVLKKLNQTQQKHATQELNTRNWAIAERQARRSVLVENIGRCSNNANRLT